MRREKPGHKRGAGLDRAEGAAGELQRGHRGVFGLDTRVHALRGPREHFHRHAGEPLQQVDAVNRLVDDRAAAILGDLSLPAGVVLGGAIPLHVATREHHAPEAPRIDRGLELPRRIAEARLENRADAHAGLLGFRQDVIGAFDRGVERLLDHEVFAGADRRERRLEVQRRRGGDAHRIEPGLRRAVHACRPWRNRCRARARTSRRWRARRLTTPDQPAAARSGHGARMEMRNGARADESETQLLFHARLVRKRDRIVAIHGVAESLVQRAPCRTAASA